MAKKTSEPRKYRDREVFSTGSGSSVVSAAGYDEMLAEWEKENAGKDWLANLPPLPGKLKSFGTE